MIARIKQSYALWKRRQARRIEQERSHRAYWQAQRRHHQRDPLWKGGAHG